MYNKQLLDVEETSRYLLSEAEADNTYRDLDYSGYRKNRI